LFYKDTDAMKTPRITSLLLPATSPGRTGDPAQPPAAPKGWPRMPEAKPDRNALPAAVAAFFDTHLKK